MVIMHIAYGLELIALTLGAGLFVWSIKNPGKGSLFGKVLGGLVMVLSLLAILCLFSCFMKDSECHGPNHYQGMMMMGQPAPEAMPADKHEHMTKKLEHQR